MRALVYGLAALAMASLLLLLFGDIDTGLPLVSLLIWLVALLAGLLLVLRARRRSRRGRRPTRPTPRPARTAFGLTRRAGQTWADGSGSSVDALPPPRR